MEEERLWALGAKGKRLGGGPRKGRETKIPKTTKGIRVLIEELGWVGDINNVGKPPHEPTKSETRSKKRGVQKRHCLARTGKTCPTPGRQKGDKKNVPGGGRGAKLHNLLMGVRLHRKKLKKTLGKNDSENAMPKPRRSRKTRSKKRGF